MFSSFHSKEQRLELPGGETLSRSRSQRSPLLAVDLKDRGQFTDLLPGLLVTRSQSLLKRKVKEASESFLFPPSHHPLCPANVFMFGICNSCYRS